MSDDTVVNKKKLSVGDFPPTIETKNLYIWDNKALSIDITPKDGELVVDIVKERFYETRIYKYRNNPDIVFKILSKIDNKSKRITVVIRTISGNMCPSDGRTFSEDEYTKEIGVLEKAISVYYNVEKVKIISGEEQMRDVQPIVDRYLKEKEMEAKK